MSAKKTPGSRTQLRIGFVPLLDAAPLIAAFENKYFSDEGLDVELERQIGWGNVRDKLVYGHLDASHALFGMPPLSVLQTDRYIDPLVSIMSMGTGGDAITFSRKMTDLGVDSAAALSQRFGNRPLRPPIMGHVFGCSVHHYLLRDWLASGGVDPDQDVTLMVLPPMQMARQMSTGLVEGFCVGEPWNTVAETQGLGRVVVTTTEILSAHPDKVLATSRRWLVKHSDTAVALIRAMLRGCEFCDDKVNRPAVAEMLARRDYLAMSGDLLLRSMNPDRWRIGAGSNYEPIRSCAMTSTFPSATHAEWLLCQMLRWGHLGSQLGTETDIKNAARQAVDTTAYRKAAAEIGLDCPHDDAPAMRTKTTRNIPGKQTGVFNAGNRISNTRK